MSEDAEKDVCNAEEEDTEGTDSNEENNAESDTQLNQKNYKLLPLSPYYPTYLFPFSHPHSPPADTPLPRLHLCAAPFHARRAPVPGVLVVDAASPAHWTPPPSPWLPRTCPNLSC